MYIFFLSITFCLKKYVYLIIIIEKNTLKIKERLPQLTN